MIFTALKQVFRNAWYVVIAGVVASAVFALATWLPNLKLIFQVITSSTTSLAAKFGIPVSLLRSITTNFTIFSASYTIAIALLFGINAAMIIYYFKQQKTISKQSGIAGFGGLISGIFGVGCAACGTLVLAPLLALIGAGGILALLPFGGQEFGMLGVGMLGFSIFVAAKKIQEPLVCLVRNDIPNKADKTKKSE